MKPTVISLLPRPPHPARDGGGIRNYHLLRALAAKFDVRAISLLPPGAEELPWEVPDGVRIETVPLAPGSAAKLLALARSLRGEPYTVARYRSSALEAALEAALRHAGPAWVVAHGFHMAGPALQSGGRAWIDLHNIESIVWRRTAETASPTVVRPAFHWQRRLVERMERRVLGDAAGVSVTSTPDARRAVELVPGVRAIVVPNGVDLARYDLRDAVAVDPVLLFVGDLRWRPNAQGVAWFCESVWPRLRAQVPKARVEILGRGAPEALARHADDRLTFVGDVPDTREAWRRAAVAIVPLLAGGGTRLKILEAAAMGVPVLSTAIGAEGLSLVPGREIAIADDPDAWVSEVADLLGRPDLGASRAAAARERVEREYDWTSIGEAFVEQLQTQS
jgi:glycosyltransferase involved in cell wall biosynthesis